MNFRSASLASLLLFSSTVGIVSGCAADSSGGSAPASSSSSSSSSSSGSTGSPSVGSQTCTKDCIEADLEMPDGSSVHVMRAAVTASVASLHRIGIGSIEGNGDLGITLSVDVTKVQANTESAAAASPASGPYLAINDHKVGSDGKALPAFVGQDGQITFTSISEASGSAVDGTFTGVLAKREGSSDVVKVTNGVFHGTVP